MLNYNKQSFLSVHQAVGICYESYKPDCFTTTKNSNKCKFKTRHKFIVTTRLRYINSNQQTVNQPVSICTVIDMSELVEKHRTAKTKNNNKGLHTAQGQPSHWSGSGCSDSTAGARDALQTERPASLFHSSSLPLWASCLATVG